MQKKLSCIILAGFTALFVTVGCSNTGASASSASSSTGIAASVSSAASQAGADASKTLSVAISEISKHGNLLLNTTFDELKAFDIEAGDIITVSMGDSAYDLPVGTSYTDVTNGEMICRLDLDEGSVGLAINSGSFAEACGVAEKRTIEKDPGYEWDMHISEVGLALKEKGGYLAEYTARQLTRSNNREDYPNLTDEEFANFRAVSVSGMKENTLYRSSSPLNPEIGRNEYAMRAMEAAGIRTVVNLDDTIEAMQSFESFPGSYYSTCAIVNVSMSTDYRGKEFAEGMKQSVLFMLEHDGPYLCHCKEGKDRTGIMCAIFECFAGASLDDVEKDYMATFINFYHLDPTSSAYGIIRDDNLGKTLCALFEIDTLNGANLKEEATQYLLSTGLSEEQLVALGGVLIQAQ